MGLSDDDWEQMSDCDSHSNTNTFTISDITAISLSPKTRVDTEDQLDTCLDELNTIIFALRNSIRVKSEPVPESGSCKKKSNIIDLERLQGILLDISNNLAHLTRNAMRSLNDYINHTDICPAPTFGETDEDVTNDVPSPSIPSVTTWDLQLEKMEYVPAHIRVGQALSGSLQLLDSLYMLPHGKRVPISIDIRQMHGGFFEEKRTYSDSIVAFKWKADSVKRCGRLTTYGAGATLLYHVADNVPHCDGEPKMVSYIRMDERENGNHVYKVVFMEHSGEKHKFRYRHGPARPPIDIKKLRRS